MGPQHGILKVAFVAVVAMILMNGAALAQRVGNGPGQISNGHCRCKALCQVGQSVFSQDHTIPQCMQMCAKAFSGCTAGEIRSTATRHEQ
jgi:hypothetical protein